MTEKFQVTRRTILAGAAFAGALAPIISTSEARAEGGEIKTNAQGNRSPDRCTASPEDRTREAALRPCP